MIIMIVLLFFFSPIQIAGYLPRSEAPAWDVFVPSVWACPPRLGHLSGELPLTRTRTRQDQGKNRVSKSLVTCKHLDIDCIIIGWHQKLVWEKSLLFYDGSRGPPLNPKHKYKVHITLLRIFPLGGCAISESDPPRRDICGVWSPSKRRLLWQF